MIAKSETTCPLMQMAHRVLGHQLGTHEETRWRLLQAATEVFAEEGYRAATTRAISKRAGVNLAAIHYHFGDKAELYREVFRLPFLNECNTFAKLEIDKVTMSEALYAFYDWIFPPSPEEDPMMHLFLRLHAREEAEPSGVMDGALAQAIRPNHEKLQRFLCRELGLKKTDAEIDRLSFCIVGLAKVYHQGGRAIVEELAPNLLKGKQAKGLMVARLVEYALAMIESERLRRTKLKRSK